MDHLSIIVKILRYLSLISLIFFFVCLPVTESLQNQNVSWAEEFPIKEITLVVPYSPGGAIDISARIFASKVQKILGVPIVVSNNTAGAGVVGTFNVKQAKPHGYTLLINSIGQIVIKPIFVPEVNYRYTDFTSVCRVTVNPQLLWVRKEAPWGNLKELADHAKKNPGKLRAAGGPAGSTGILLINLFEAEAGIDIADIPTTGGTSMATSLIGGHVELSTSVISTMMPFFRAEKVRPLASTHKLPEFPMIKTFKEEGYPEVNRLEDWVGIFAPKGLPHSILTKLTNTFEKAILDPSVQEDARKTAVYLDYRNPQETSKLLENLHEVILKVSKGSKDSGAAK